ncbi:4-amino-4-deoxychorismate lyase [Sodalis-like endosymbiont of Proechinophthirus fluctus]|uniref:aminodeoxychorismate lyase n=1 Tax=Sodalis-like endosymbiont of Proechinophthirus fluctus TaxID=1462730 RepID=UPI0007A89734|nr:aminodeoxychorismate lyase [Sodalis-like endosymbiont of Proechinophthirus fluctus]KYP97299.1 4-amino-4-deoxychorismate lyase [Sodalis-like endosymbiont of Proechinophthirus fluctus]
MYWINSIPQAQLPLTDRAVHFGDGFFTTARLLDGDIPLLEWHLERLSMAGQRLLFAPFNADAMRREMLAAAHGSGDGVIKALISRGSGGNGYSFRGCETPQRIVSRTPAPAQYPRWRQDGVRLSQSPVRLARNPLLAGIKHNNRLEQVLVRAHLDRNGTDEALVLDTEGIVVECCSANLFWRCGREVFTPALRYAGVAGVMRRRVMSLLPELGYTLEEVSVGPNALTMADEVFITNALLPVVPVRAIDTRQYADRTLCLQLSPLC